MVDKRRVDLDLFTKSGADFDGIYRYDLFRTWDESKPMVLFVMLNPSTADEYKLDRTVNRCRIFAEAWGCGSFHVVNVFALISTDPKALDEAKDPIGPHNDKYIKELAKKAGKVIVAWGSYKLAATRSEKVLKALRKHHKELYCLGTTKDGKPRHPLYVASSTQLVVYDGKKAEKSK